jgi:hypothetical protein
MSIHYVNHYEYSAEIGCKYGELTPIIKWCEKNCTGDWTINFNNNNYASNGNLYTFEFNTKEDYINFLIWKK